MYIQIKEEKTAILKIYLKTLKVLERQKFSKYFAPIDIVKIETCFRNNKKAKNEGKKKIVGEIILPCQSAKSKTIDLSVNYDELRELLKFI